MDAYPRATTWPQLLIVAALFLAAIIVPRWWRSLEPHERLEMTSSVNQAISRVARDVWKAETDFPASPDTDFKLVGSVPQIAELKPPVAQRVVIEPSDSSEESSMVINIDGPLDPRPSQVEPSIADLDSSESESEQRDRDSIEAIEFDLEHITSALPEKSAVPTTSELESEWPEPTALLNQLDALCSAVDRVEQWRVAMIDLLADLQATNSLDNERVDPILRRLSNLVAQSTSMELLVTETDRVIIRQIAYGIQRRVALWSAVHELARGDHEPPVVVVSDALPLLRAVEARLAAAEHAESWHSYLMLDKLNQIATSTWETDASVRQSVARDVLTRTRHVDLTDAQREFLDEPTFRQLISELRRWAQARIELPKLTQTIEQFETARSGRLANHIVKELSSLRWLDASQAKRMTSELETHYRNANIRIAITDGLMNDLLPVLEPIQEQVRDEILGATVRGRNNTWTRLRVNLLEARDRIQLRFEAAGDTRSSTISTKGPIRFYNRGHSIFQAGKDISLSHQGLFLSDATATAKGNSELTNVESEYDRIPLLGWVLRQIAVDELRENRGLMRREVNGRVSRAARDRLDESLQERVDEVQQEFTERLLDPLRDLQLEPKALEMRSTPDRMVMRCRIASKQQLAAYTPRPRALSNSVLSLQLHESSANNLFQQLDLSGKRLELEELMAQLADKLQVDVEDIRDEIPQGVSIRLGHDRPIQIRFDDDRVVVTIRIAELATQKRKWRSFVVLGRYRADVNRMHIDLEREGGIELISDRLAFRDQIALRGIFTKVMTKSHRMNVVRGRFVNDPRLANLKITQFVVRDGWIGISVGPQPAEHVANEAAISLK